MQLPLSRLTSMAQLCPATPLVPPLEPASSSPSSSARRPSPYPRSLAVAAVFGGAVHALGAAHLLPHSTRRRARPPLPHTACTTLLYTRVTTLVAWVAPREDTADARSRGTHARAAIHDRRDGVHRTAGTPERGPRARRRPLEMYSMYLLCVQHVGARPSLRARLVRRLRGSVSGADGRADAGDVQEVHDRQRGEDADTDGGSTDADADDDYSDPSILIRLRHAIRRRRAVHPTPLETLVWTACVEERAANPCAHSMTMTKTCRVYASGALPAPRARTPSETARETAARERTGDRQRGGSRARKEERCRRAALQLGTSLSFRLLEPSAD
ncbi:hypothetical protein FB451DRAFT_1565570 [Mycena latifolia]|nr:hypothetical protein FB451DRAFT_1565570 [Mycena latifolia]